MFRVNNYLGRLGGLEFKINLSSSYLRLISDSGIRAGGGFFRCPRLISAPMSITSRQTLSVDPRGPRQLRTDRLHRPRSLAPLCLHCGQLRLGRWVPLLAHRDRPTDQHTHSFFMAHGLLRPTSTGLKRTSGAWQGERGNWGRDGRAAEPSLLARSSPLLPTLATAARRRWPPLTWPDGRRNGRPAPTAPLSLSLPPSALPPSSLCLWRRCRTRPPPASSARSHQLERRGGEFALSEDIN